LRNSLEGHSKNVCNLSFLYIYTFMSKVCIVHCTCADYVYHFVLRHVQISTNISISTFYICYWSILFVQCVIVICLPFGSTWLDLRKGVVGEIHNSHSQLAVEHSKQAIAFDCVKKYVLALCSTTCVSCCRLFLSVNFSLHDIPFHCKRIVCSISIVLELSRNISVVVVV